MKYKPKLDRNHYALIAILLLICYFGNKFSDNPQVNGQEKATTPEGKDTLITVKK